MIKTNQEPRGRIPRYCRSMSGTEIHGTNDLDGMAGILMDDLTNRAVLVYMFMLSAGSCRTRNFVARLWPRKDMDNRWSKYGYIVAILYGSSSPA